MMERPRAVLETAARSAQPVKPAALANGVFAVLAESTVKPAAKPGDGSRATLFYEQKYAKPGRKEPARFVTLDTAFFVPLVLAGPPAPIKDSLGQTALSAKLAPAHVKSLEGLTRAQLNGKVAVVIGGEIITMPTVRSVITGGDVMISGCQNDGCEALRTQLTK